LKGIISKLDYLQELGAETIWISPFFESPQQDFGYDISDYYRVDSLFGDNKILSELIEEIHKRKMYVVFDLVMNHTSDKHNWFKESATDSNNPKADWYVWKDGRNNNKRPPNNWKSTIGGSGWHFHNGRNQWYFSSFLPWQPDLNYHKHETKEAMLDVARYWLSKGVDGFRLDIFNVIYEDRSFKNNPFSWRALPSTENPDGFQQKMKYTVNHPQNYIFAKELRAVLDSFEGKRFAVGEVFGDHEAIKKYTGENADGLNLVFLFDMLDFKFNANFFANKIKSYEKHYPSPFFPTLVFSNHDRKRSISRIGNDPEKAKLIALFQLTARGTPFLYQGEEIGMTQAKIPTKKALDPLAIKYKWIPQFLVNCSKESLNRDECRTPMQWNSSPNSGFCPETITPWLPVNSNYNLINVESAKNDSSSLWHHYNKLLKIRKKYPALQTGDIEILNIKKSKNILAYCRSYKGIKMDIFINFSVKERIINYSSINSEIIYNQNNENKIEGRKLILKGYSSLIIKYK
jgi:alpha-glucosidase